MKNIFTCLLVLLIYHSYGQDSIAILTGNGELNVLTKDKILKDLDEYKKCIASNHINPFTFITEQEFNARLDSIRTNADRYNIDELLFALLKLNAGIKDEHTGLDYHFKERFPFICYHFSDGIRIISVEANNEDLRYAQVIAVNGIPINEVYNRLAEIVPTTNQGVITTYFSRNLFNPFLLHGSGITASRDNVKYTLVTRNNDTIKMAPRLKEEHYTDMQPATTFDKWLRFTNRDENYWMVDTDDCIYLKYNRCRDNPANPMKVFLKKLEHDIKKNHPKKLIIDLRDNSGGNSSLLDDLIDYLASSTLNRKGGIYVLTGKLTFSSAVLNATDLKTKTAAIIVGNETGGNVNHFGEIKSYTLPNTKIEVKYSTKHFVRIEGYEGGLKPDVYIPEKFSDVMNNIDAPLAYALRN